MPSPDIQAALRRALQLAEQAVGLTDPNPRVGCVLLAADDRRLGEGHTQAAGQAHAEVRTGEFGGGPLQQLDEGPVRDHRVAVGQRRRVDLEAGQQGRGVAAELGDELRVLPQGRAADH